MKKTAMILLISTSLLLVIFNWEWVMQLREENLSYFTDELFPELGYRILLITIPLMMIQNVITIFPIIILIMVHFISFGMIFGFLFSLIGTSLGALLCFWITRTVSEKTIQKYWKRKEEKLSYILDLLSSYGVFMIVFLRSIPIMPSNLISIAAGVSPINDRAYAWSTLLGNISMVWLLSLLSGPLWINENQYFGYLVGYVIFSLFVLLFYFMKFFRKNVQ
ncbi:TVP38/TMEM64 family protein [Salipaludibacillus daqingensis]|uniref:TVP38/TMEM64 family protein n=1 Tax=Salipaludibacillus daqingensis TaxID=3041001 RepID=UPI0024734869|nr:VTT domain-containing protein [Salipaludibacillus daqingensis]